MVQFEKIANTEYVVRQEGEATVEDPVGEWLFDRYQEKPHTKISLGKIRKTYEQLLDDFENKNMTKEIYDALMKKARPESLSKQRERRIARGLIRHQRLEQIFGRDLSMLSESEREELTETALSVKKIKTWVSDYFHKRRDELPTIFGYYARILNASRRKLSDLEKELRNVRNVLAFQMRQHYEEDLRFPENYELAKEYLKARNKGDIFKMWEIFERFEKEYNRFEISEKEKQRFLKNK